MQLKNYSKLKISFFVALSLTFVLVSCGSYQYVGYDNDGIYNDDVSEEVVYVEDNSSNNSNYYKNYFSEKAQEYEDIIAENEIFTDIDSYEGSYEDIEQDSIQTNEYEDYRVGYAGWGQENSDVTINIYNDNFGYNYWWYRPYRFGWSWYRPYSWSFGWSYWNYPYAYNSWWAPHYYGGYYYNPYYYGYGYSSVYSRRHVAYNAGRRGTPYLNSRTSRNTRTITRSTRNSIQTKRYSRSNSTISRNNSTIRRNNSTIRRNSTTIRNNRSTTSPKSNSTIKRSTTTPRVNTPSRSRSYNNIRTSTPTRSSSSTRSSSRSSGRSYRR